MEKEEESKSVIDWITKGKKYREEKLFLKAIDSFKQAVIADPFNASAWFEKGYTHYIRYDEDMKNYNESETRFGHIRMAETCVTNVLQLEPEHKEAKKLNIEIQKILLDYHINDIKSTKLLIFIDIVTLISALIIGVISLINFNWISLAISMVCFILAFAWMTLALKFEQTSKTLKKFKKILWD